MSRGSVLIVGAAGAVGKRLVNALAARGDITVTYTEYQLENALQAYHDLEAGQVKGRAVIVP